MANAQSQTEVRYVLGGTPSPLVGEGWDGGYGRTVCADVPAPHRIGLRLRLVLCGSPTWGELECGG